MTAILNWFGDEGNVVFWSTRGSLSIPNCSNRVFVITKAKGRAGMLGGRDQNERKAMRSLNRGLVGNEEITN